MYNIFYNYISYIGWYNMFRMNIFDKYKYIIEDMYRLHIV